MSFGEKKKAREYFSPVYIPVYQEINFSSVNYQIILGKNSLLGCSQECVLLRSTKCSK